MQQLSVDMIKQAGAFAPAKPERREIKWASDDGEIHEAVIFVRKKSFLTLLEESKAGPDPDSNKKMAVKIVGGIVGEDGNPIFSLDDILGNEEHGPICSSLAMALLSSIYDAEGLGKKADPKSLMTTPSSGVSLSSQASEEER